MRFPLGSVACATCSPGPSPASCAHPPCADDFIQIDDCWAASQRDPSGAIVADPTRFPSGMKALADYVHGKGMKLGLCEYGSS